MLRRKGAINWNGSLSYSNILIIDYDVIDCIIKDSISRDVMV